MSNILSHAIANWILDYRRLLESKKKSVDGAKIEVNDVAGKLAFVYEKIRNTVDYKEDHLLRKNAIARIVRRVLVSGKKGSDISLPLIEELIRARYLPNNELPEKIIDVIRDIVNKYIVIYNSIADMDYRQKELSRFLNWLIGLAACEIEEALVPSDKTRITVEAMERVIKQNVVLDNIALSDADRDLEIYIAVLDALIKADEMTVNYELMKRYFPAWSNLSLAEASNLALDIKNKQSLIKNYYLSPLHERLTREFKSYAVIFWILRGIIEDNQSNFVEIFENKAELMKRVTLKCKQKYGQIGAKVRRAIIRSVIYIFCTKIIFGILLELPYDLFILRHIQFIPLGINVVFPPLLMAMIGLSIRTPKQDNTAAIIQHLDHLVYNFKGSEHRLKNKQSPRGFLHLLLRFLYFITYLISFGLIIYGLRYLHFSLASMIIFIFFLTLVSFFSLRIRKTAAEFIILKKRDRFLPVMITFLFVPILRVGRWLALHSSKINVFIFILDFIIEAPFKMFIRIFEDLIVFIKEKRDEMLS